MYILKFEGGFIIDFSTTVIKEEIEQFLSAAYLLLFREYFLITFAMVISCAVFPVFIVRLIGKYEQNRIKKGELPQVYIFKATAKLGLHYTILFFMLAFAIGNVYHSILMSKNTLIYNKKIIFLSIILMIYAFYAAFYLFSFYSRGLILTNLFVVLYSVYNQYLWFLTARSTLYMSEKYNTVARYGAYTIVDYMAMQSVIMSVLTVIIVVLIVLYYYRRRYLFTPGRLNMPFCVHCGKAINKGDNFCTCCGQQVHSNPVYQTVMPLDEDIYCRKCGNNMSSSGCVRCEGVKVLEKFVKEKSKENKVSLIRGTLITIIIIAIIFLPLIRNPVEALQRGTANINNAFVGRWNEFCSLPDKAADPEWLDGFDSDAEALYLVDMRWYYVNPRQIPYRELVFYSVYAEASFMQMEVLEQMKEFVHAISAEGTAAVDNFYDECEKFNDKINQTISAQSSASQSLINENMVGLCWHSICNGFNYYIANVDITFIAIAVIVIDFSMLLWLLNGFSMTGETKPEHWSRMMGMRSDKLMEILRTTPIIIISDSTLHRLVASTKDCLYSLIRFLNELLLLVVRICCVFCLFLTLFRVRNTVRCLRWLRDGLTNPQKLQGKVPKHKSFWRHERILAATAVVILVVSVVMPYVLRMSITDDGEMVLTEEEYLDDATMASVIYAVDIMEILQEIKNTKTLNENDKERLYALIDAQIEADQVILDFDMTDLEAYEEFHAALCSLCRDDIKALQKIRDSIDDGLIPSLELQLNYVSLRAENYSWVIERIGQEYLEMFVEEAYSL